MIPWAAGAPKAAPKVPLARPGDHATKANALLDEDDRPGHELPVIT